MARPDKLTPEVQARLISAISAGNYYQAACAFAGIHYATFRKWMARGSEARHGKFREFREAVLNACAGAEVRIVAQWQQHIPQNWQAARDFLERRFPARWSKKKSIGHTGTVQHRVEISAEDLSDDELAAIVRGK